MASRHNGSDTNAPPRPLGKAGQDLWTRINMDFILADETSRETLCQICEAQDHTAELCEAIKAESPIIATEKGDRKAHPGYQIIRQHRSFILRSLERLKGQHNKTMKILGRPVRSAMGYDPWEEKS
jgi:hypothetical protein